MSELNGNLENHGVVLLRVWPKQDALAAPDHVPPNLANFFLQGLRALKTESWDAAGMMFRKVLDVATLSINPTTSKKTLVKRIDDMRASGALTKDLADWAHEIRTEGNEAAHEEEPFGREEAESLRDFCEYFLIYVYSLPKRIANKRIQS